MLDDICLTLLALHGILHIQINWCIASCFHMRIRVFSLNVSIRILPGHAPHARYDDHCQDAKYNPIHKLTLICDLISVIHRNDSE